MTLLVRKLMGGFRLWAVLSLLGAAALAAAMVQETPARTVFLPGETTHGHYQIELSCSSCHTGAFADKNALQAACENCHATELKQANDSHPRSKFTDPRNAARVSELDARFCVTCHSEHNAEATGLMAVTLPQDYCYRCHQDIGEERPSHIGLPFASCDDVGCHNFHDNKALYEDFLARHLDENDHLTRREAAMVSERPLEATVVAPRPARSAVSASSFDAPSELALSAEQRDTLERSVHSRAGVNCRECHTGPERGEWIVAPSLQACDKCHQSEAEGFRAGRHGMRLGAGLTPMRVEVARLPMNADAGHRELGCDSCHGAHDYDTRRAASSACVECHADEHTQNYDASPHAALWRRELEGKGAAKSGVSCATCHLPRLIAEDGRFFVEHNQNANLRPSEKMVREVCLSCHGLEFTLNSLADADLVRKNFAGHPQVNVPSLQFVRERTASATVQTPRSE